MINLRPLAYELHRAGGRWPDAFTEPNFALFGSSVMMLHGLRQEIADVDLFVTPALWGRLVEQGWGWQTPKAGDPPFAYIESLPGIPPVHAFYAWDERHDYLATVSPLNTVEAAFAGVQLVEAPERRERWRGHVNLPPWPCQSLEQLLMWKRWLFSKGVHPKHGTDAELIEEFLSR